MQRKWPTIGILVGILVGTGAWLLQSGAASDGRAHQQARLLESVVELVAGYYVDSIAEADLYQRAARGVVEKLNDPYSVLLIGQEFQRAHERSTGNYGGIGARVDARAGAITVVAPLPNSPAERAGLQIGDQIVAIDGRDTHTWSLQRAADGLRGPLGSSVVLRVRRVGIDSTLTYTLTRDRIHRRGVKDGIFLDRGVGYVSYDFVSEGSARELGLELAGLRALGMHSVVLDLRGNPGGMRDEAVAAADLFLDPGDTLLVTAGRTETDSRNFVDQFPQPWPELRVVVVVDRQAASAAEILAGAIQDHDRGLIVGQPTFGKGLVQTQFRLGDDVALRITTARWFTPSGRSIQRTEGVHLSRSAGAQQDPGSYQSAGGRRLRGGGGIIPDVALPTDSVDTDERALAQALTPHLAAFRDVVTRFALDLKKDGFVEAEDFTVTPAMRREVLNRLADRAVEIDPTLVEAGGTLVDRQVGYEVARYVFGPTAELRRRAKDDEDLQHALRLLREHETTESLLGLGPAPVVRAANPM